MMAFRDFPNGTFSLLQMLQLGIFKNMAIFCTSVLITNSGFSNLITVPRSNQHLLEYINMEMVSDSPVNVNKSSYHVCLL